jgi:hypothetical protein
MALSADPDGCLAHAVAMTSSAAIVRLMEWFVMPGHAAIPAPRRVRALSAAARRCHCARLAV